MWHIYCNHLQTGCRVQHDKYHKTDEKLSHSNQIQRLFFEF